MVCKPLIFTNRLQVKMTTFFQQMFILFASGFRGYLILVPPFTLLYLCIIFNIIFLLQEPKLLSGLTFYLSGDYSASYKGYLQDLVMAAGGTILQRRPISRDYERLLGVSSVDKILIVYSVEPPQKYNLDSNEVIDRRRFEAEVLADASGCSLATSSWIIDSIAACKLRPLT